MTILTIVLDAKSTPTFARKISDHCIQRFVEANVLNEIDIDPAAHILIVGFEHNFYCSHSSFTLPTIGNQTTYNLCLNPQAIDVRNQTKLYYMCRSDGIISLEFYRIVGGLPED